MDRYISWPGQALSYKMGEIKIRQLRAEAEKALGDKFDLRKFHDAVLANGALPLPLPLLDVGGRDRKPFYARKNFASL